MGGWTLRAADSTELAVRVGALATELDILAASVSNLWVNLGLDPRGGAYGHLDRRWTPVVDLDGHPKGPSGEVRGDKGLVQQARHLYAYSLDFEIRGQEVARQAAYHMRDFLFERMAKPEGVLFWHQVTAAGEPRNGVEQLYAQFFAVYALATFGRVFEDYEATSRALAAFRHLDARRHDPENWGYSQQEDGGWLEFVGAPPGAARCTNTHIHIIEALAALLRAAPAELGVATRLRELLECMMSLQMQTSGYVHPYFSANWAPVGPSLVSYGHDMETAWFLLDGVEALQRSALGADLGLQMRSQEAAVRVAAHAIRTGSDSSLAGGLFDYGVPEGPGLHPRILGTDKIWWVQAECVAGSARLFLLTGDARYLDTLEGTLAFLRDRLWDPESGEWFWGQRADGTLGARGDHKGELWKTPYHGLRALLLSRRWLMSWSGVSGSQ